VILIILLLIGFISLRNMAMLREDNLLVAHTHEVLAKLNAISGDLQDAETGQRGYLLTGMEKYLEPYDNGITKLNNDVDDLRQLTSDNPKQQQQIVILESLIKEKRNELDETIKTRRNIGFDNALEIVKTDKGKQVMDNIRVILSESENIEYQLLQERHLREDRSVRNAKNTILFCTAASIIIVIFFIIYLTVNIAMPIRKISGIAEKISEGELTIEISDTQRKDEVGILIKTFSRMIIYLKEMTKIANMISERKLNIEIKPLSEKDVLGNAFSLMQENLKSQVLEITETVSIITAMVSEIIATSSQLTSSSTETVSAISETTTTVEEVKQTAQVNNEKSKEISESSRKTVQVARDGEKAVSETGAGMDRIREQMEFIAESIMRLSEQSQSIGEIMNSINDLAEQSNLLAVNASIEAAKAGEEGKGFAVVAEEVKRLADQSKQATKQVREILTDIQKATSSAVMATEEGSKVVDAGLKQADNAGASIKVLTEVINEASLATAQIGASVQQQFVGIDQVTEAIRSISVASNQNLESTRQLEEASEKLEVVAKNLERLVEQYQI